jgi:hypothetical protein
MNNKYCLVEGCRFPQFHITAGHRCLCGEYGHGRMECRNYQKIQDLKIRSSVIIFPQHEHCTIPGCTKKNTHKKESHICGICNSRGHGGRNCHTNTNTQQKFHKIKCPSCRIENKVSHEQKPIVGVDVDCIICFGKANMFLPQCGHINVCFDCIKKMDEMNNQQNNNHNQNYIHIEPLETITALGQDSHNFFDIPFEFDNNNEYIQIKEGAKKIFGDKTGKIFLCSYAGMGCYFFVKRDDINAEIKVFFMHSDSWGQYGHSDVGELNDFLRDYIPIYNNI